MVKVQGQLYKINLTEHPEVEIHCKGTSIAKLQWLQSQEVKINEKDPKKREAVFTFFAKRVISWNLDHPDFEDEDEDSTEDGACIQCGQLPGEPLEVNAKSMMCLEMGFVMSIIFGWMFAVARVSVPKGMNSNSGVESIQEEAMKRLASLQNPLTLGTPNSSSE